MITANEARQSCWYRRWNIAREPAASKIDNEVLHESISK
jgi:hypothetical protein